MGYNNVFTGPRKYKDPTSFPASWKESFMLTENMSEFIYLKIVELKNNLENQNSAY